MNYELRKNENFRITFSYLRILKQCCKKKIILLVKIKVKSVSSIRETSNIDFARIPNIWHVIKMKIEYLANRRVIFMMNIECLVRRIVTIRPNTEYSGD